MESKKKDSGFFNGLLAATKVLAKFTKVFKFGLVGLSLFSYAYLLTWQFAVIIVVQLLVHEYGHIFAMKRAGIQTKGIYLIPFVGGVAVGNGSYRTRKDGVVIAMFGPLFGSGLALVMWGIYIVTRNPMFAAGASWMALLNLINLLPIVPLDGGHVQQNIAYSIGTRAGLWMMSVSVALGTVMMVLLHWWIFVIFLPICLVENIAGWVKLKRWKERVASYQIYYDNETDPQKKEYRKKDLEAVIAEQRAIEPMSRKQMITSACVYVLFLLALYFVMVTTKNVEGAGAAMKMLE